MGRFWAFLKCWPIVVRGLFSFLFSPEMLFNRRANGSKVLSLRKELRVIRERRRFCVKKKGCGAPKIKLSLCFYCLSVELLTVMKRTCTGPFVRLHNALTFCKTGNQSKDIREGHLFCWAEEVNPSGARRFWVASRKGFYKSYTKINRSKKCFYEIIQEGAPCRLFFDLEFDQLSNRQSDGKKMMKVLCLLFFCTVLITFQTHRYFCLVWCLLYLRN